MAARKRRRRRGGRRPPVHVEEVPSGARPIEAVGTSVAAFVGFARENPVRLVAALVVVSAVVAGAWRLSRRGG